MDTLLLGITIVSLIVALVMSVTAWRVMRDDKRRSAARIAALAAASVDSTEYAEAVDAVPLRTSARPVVVETPLQKAPWSPATITETPVVETPVARVPEPVAVHASGFLGAQQLEQEGGSRQKSLAFAAAMLFVVLSGGLVWMMSGPEGTTAVAVGPNAPLELVSLSHARQNQKLAVSGLVRNPANGKPVERLSAVVFLFDRMGTFVTSSRAHVDFLKLGAGDETPFVVSIDAPSTVARYRVSFRTDEGVVPHIDRRGDSPAAAAGEQPINVSAR